MQGPSQWEACIAGPEGTGWLRATPLFCAPGSGLAVCSDQARVRQFLVHKTLFSLSPSSSLQSALQCKYSFAGTYGISPGDGISAPRGDLIWRFCMEAKGIKSVLLHCCLVVEQTTLKVRVEQRERIYCKKCSLSLIQSLRHINKKHISLTFNKFEFNFTISPKAKYSIKKIAWSFFNTKKN